MPANDDVTFHGRTFLLIRDHPQDDGTEPVPAALPAWLSPDITVRSPAGIRGAEAEAGRTNHVEITLRNLGGIPAVGVFVDAFYAHPATGFTPGTAALVGGAYVDVPGYGTTLVSLPWTPPASYAGHGCLLARASLFVPPDSYADPMVFDTRGDRHIAQRNIEVLSFQETGESLPFVLDLVNPRSEPVDARIELREVPAEQRADLGPVLGCPSLSFAEASLGEFGIRAVGARLTPDAAVALPLAPLFEHLPHLPDTLRPLPGGPGDLSVRFPPGAPQPYATSMSVRLGPGEVCRAEVSVKRNPYTLPGTLHALEIRQFDEAGEVMGGLSLVLCN